MGDIIGKVLNGRYKIETFIGRGGMADVYRAQDLRRDIPVALKFLREDLSEDRAFRRRFQREAQILASLQHPNIVRLYGFETAGVLSFLIMEHINGQVLRRILLNQEQPLTLGQALGILEPVCRALSYAHKEGVYHCDVKPANIFLVNDGRVVLSDFGISRLSESSTVTYSTPGTPAYMAPEQIRGEQLDSRTDIYALGITLYEMLALERPFEGEDAESNTSTSRSERIRWEHLHKQPRPLHDLIPEINPQIEQFVIRALAKSPDERFQSVEEFNTDLYNKGSVKVIPVVQWLSIEEDDKAGTSQAPRGAHLEELYSSLQEAIHSAKNTRDLKRASELCGEILSLDPTFRDVADLLVQTKKEITFLVNKADSAYLHGRNTIAKGLVDIQTAYEWDPDHSDADILFPILKSHKWLTEMTEPAKAIKAGKKAKARKRWAFSFGFGFISLVLLAGLFFIPGITRKTEQVGGQSTVSQPTSILPTPALPTPIVNGDLAIAYGETIDVSPTTSNQLFVFYGEKGDRISIVAIGGASLNLLDGTERALKSKFSSINFYSLPDTGNHFIQVDSILHGGPIKITLLKH